jgi:hypothetical protein
LVRRAARLPGTASDRFRAFPNKSISGFSASD